MYHMTLRGEQLISPLVQTSQQLQANAMTSSTPLPLNYYQARPLMLPQGVYECLPPAQIHSFNPYQAYGGYLSDTRGQPGNIGSGVPAQQNFTQGNNYCQQPVTNVMLQQPQQSQAYHVTVHPQSNMRHSTPSHQPQMMFTSQNVIPTSNVFLVPSNMYPAAKVPSDPRNTFVQDGATCSNIEFYPNESPASCETGIQPIAAAPPRPVQLTRKVLNITDPDTGRDISVELFSTCTEQHHEEISTVNQNDKEMCQTFSRLIVDRLKSPDRFNTSTVSTDSREANVSVSTISPAGVPSNHQYQPPVSTRLGQQQQPSFTPAATVVLPLVTGPHVLLPTHPAMPQQTRFTAAQPQVTQNEVLAVNLSMRPPPYFLQPPPQLLCNTIWQQHQYPSSHHFPAHTQPFQQQQQQQPIKPPGVALAHPPLQQNSAELLQSQHQPPQRVHSQPPNILGDPGPQSHKAEVCATDEQIPLIPAAPTDSMYVQPTGPPLSSTVTPAPMSSALPQTVECTDSRPSSVATISGEEVTIMKSPGDISRAEASLEVISQDMTDTLNATNNNKDFNSKQIEKLDMGGFIDSFQSTQEIKSNPVKTTVESSSVGLLGNRERDRDTQTTVIAKYVTQRDATSSCDIQSDTETSAKRDIKKPSVVMELDSAEVKLLNVDGASGESSMNNITRTNKTLIVTSVATGPIGAMVQHSGQELVEAKSVIPALASGSADWNAQRNVPVAESGDITFDSCSSSDESASALQFAETQKLAATPSQGRISRLERKKRKTGLQTQTKQKVNPWSSPNRHLYVHSKEVETYEKIAQLALEVERKFASVPIALLQGLSNVRNVQVHTVTPTQPYGTEKNVVLSQELTNLTNVQVHTVTPTQPDGTEKNVVLSQELTNLTNVKVHTVTPTQPDGTEKNVVLSQELTNLTNAQVHTVTPTQPDGTEKKVVPIMQTETKLVVEASQPPSKPVAINISDPTKHQNQPQTEQTRNTAEISGRAQGQTDRQNSNTLESGLAIAVHGELAPTISTNIVGDSFKADYPVADEDHTLESVPLQESEDLKNGQSRECSSTAASRPSTENTEVQTKRLQYDRAYLLKLRECAASQKLPHGLELQDLEIIVDKPIPKPKPKPIPWFKFGSS